MREAEILSISRVEPHLLVRRLSDGTQNVYGIYTRETVRGIGGPELVYLAYREGFFVIEHTYPPGYLHATSATVRAIRETHYLARTEIARIQAELRVQMERQEAKKNRGIIQAVREWLSKGALKWQN